jgi:NADH-quinone oxidoreductase subunit L
MTIPLYVLAFLAVVGGFLGLPAVVTHFTGIESWIHHFLAGGHGPVAEAAVAPHDDGFFLIEILLLVLGALIAVGGVFFAWKQYVRHGLAYDGMLRRRFGALYRWWQHKYYVDELYDRTVVQPIVQGSRRGLQPFDQGVVDGAVNGVAAVARGFAGVLRHVQTGIVQNYALAIAFGVVLVVSLMLFI